MRILALGDLHLGAGASFGAPGERLRDQVAVLHRIVDLALGEQVDALLLAGDIFHRPHPDPPTLLTFDRPIARLRAAGIPALAIVGNLGHDQSGADRECALDVFRHAIDVHRKPGIWEIGDVRVATLPSVPVHRLVASRNGGDRDALNAEAAELLLDTARGLRADIADKHTAILLAHWSVSGAVTPTGADVGVFREPVLPLAELEAIGFDAVVLGHIHRGQLLSPGPLSVDGNGSHVVKDRRPIFYTGSAAVVDWSEGDTPHGCWILDTEGPSLSFHEIEDRPFLTWDVDFLDGDDFSMILEGYEPLVSQARGAVVRLRYQATEEQARRIDEAAVRGALDVAGAHRVFLQPSIVREARARVEGADETLTPLEALHMWCEHQEIEAAMRDEMGARTATYLETLA
ncbi:MAG: metallophosphoesterase family protein [Thermoleophilaceae bacterium]